MTGALRMIALFLAVMAMAKATTLSRKRIVWKVNDADGAQQEGAKSNEENERILNVLLEGTIDDIGNEDWRPLFDMSLSMSKPPSPSPNEIYHPITNAVLNDYCREVYSGTSSAVRGQDEFDWCCKLDDDNDDVKRLISIPDVCQKQWSANHKEVLLSGTADDWACVDWDKAKYVVVPVLVVANDFHSDSYYIQDAVESVTAAMVRVQSWYQRKMSSGKTFRLSRPILQLSSKSAKEWNELSCLTGSPPDRPQECIDQTSEADRFGYYYEGQAEAMETSLPPWPQEQTVPTFVFSGPNSDPFWLGAAAAGPYSVNPPNVAVCPTDSEDCGLYSIGHEMGHSFGLAHSCEVVSEPKCYNGIMQNPPDILEAVLFSPEQVFLNTSPYFE